MASIDYNYDFASLAKMEGEKAIQAAKAAAKGSPITALALVLAVVATKMTENLMDLAVKVGDVKQAKVDFTNNPANKGKQPDEGNETYLTALLQSETQKLAMFMQAMSNAIKTLGESETAVARKG